MTRVCNACGTPYSGRLDEEDNYVPFVVDCDECGEKRVFVTEDEYENA